MPTERGVWSRSHDSHMFRRRVSAIVVGVAIASGLASPVSAQAKTRATLIEYDGAGYPFDIVAGADGNMWFTSSSDSQVVRITPTGQMTFFPTPSPSSLPLGITAGPDGALWLTDAAADRIGRTTMTAEI